MALRVHRRRPASLCRCQRRRGRTGHVQGPTAAADQPLRGDRGPADIGLRHRGVRRLPRGEGQLHHRDRCPAAGAGRGGGSRLARRHHGHPRHRPRGVPLRRGEGPARGDRGQRAPPPLASPVPPRAVRHRSAVGLGIVGGGSRRPGHPGLQPHAGEQRREPGPGGVDDEPRGGGVPVGGHRRVAGHSAGQRGGRRHQTDGGRGGDGNPSGRCDRHGRRRAPSSRARPR